MYRCERLIIAVLFVTVLLAGCAPRTFEHAESYYARQAKVTDGAARPATGWWYLRFNELTISDLDDAIRAGQSGNPGEMRRLADKTLRAATALGVASASGEIDRMPERERAALARRAGSSDDPAALQHVYAEKARQEIEREIGTLASLDPARALARLRKLRSSIHSAPDDRGRAGRQLALAWAAAPAWAGLEKVDREHAREQLARLEKVYERAALWRPPDAAKDDLLVRYAPTIAIEWPDDRTYPPDYDRFGQVYLTGTTKRIDVQINTSRPTVYTYRSEAKIHGKRYPQLVYSWWYPYRPEMKVKDPAAGHIDGDTFRMTLDAQNRPAVFEVLQSCGCGHLVFVARHVEAAAEREFGSKEPGKQLFVEKDLPDQRDLIIGRVVEEPSSDVHPIVYVIAGFHEVSGVDLEGNDRRADLQIVEEHGYEMADYDVLERLPLDGGVASMFGPDGLVHNAGRPEGLLLAPTGILSAGQPRKRGTQKIRWDEFSLDDPRLLEKALRLPSTF